MSEFDKALTAKIKGLIPTQSFVAKVVSVNETKYTCTVMPIDSEVEVFKVRLKPTIDTIKKGIIAIPADDSFVLVGLLNNNINSAFVIWCSNIKKMYIIGDSSFELQLNGDNLGGLIKIDDLKTQWDANVTAIKAAIVAALAPADAIETLVGIAPTSSTIFNGLASTIQNLNKTTLENTKVKHGS